MNRKYTKKLLALLAFATAGLSGPVAFAAQDLDYSGGTAAGTEIVNNASLSYSVNSVDQDDIATDDDDTDDNFASKFVVDRILDVDVTAADVAEVEVSPGADGGAVGAVSETDGSFLSFDVTNQSNDTIDILLGVSRDAANNPFGNATVEVDPAEESTFLTMCIDNQDGGAVCDTELTGEGTNSDSFRLTSVTPGTAGTTRIVVFFDISSAADNGDYDAYSLVAAVTDPDDSDNLAQIDTNGNIQLGSSEATTDVPDDGDAGDSDETVGDPQNVFGDDTGVRGYDFVADLASTTADGDSDGQHSDTSVFAIVAAELFITKTSLVIYDPVNGEDFGFADTAEAGSGGADPAFIADAVTTGGEITGASTGANPKALPGAVVEYTITVTNNDPSSSTDAEDADEIVVTDGAPTDTTGGNDEANSGLTPAGEDLDFVIIRRCDGTTVEVIAMPTSGDFTANIGTCAHEDSATITFYVTID